MSDDITYDQILEKYPILAPIRFERLPPCSEIISLVKLKLEEACKILDDPTSSGITNPILHLNIVSSNSDVKAQVKPESGDANTIDIESKQLNILVDLRNPKNPEIKQIAITEMSNLSEKRDLWKEKSSWKIIELLVNSDEISDTRDGIYILTEQLKRSKKILGENNSVVKIANELFGHKLLENIKPSSTDRISSDSLNTLEIILDYDSLFDICVVGLIHGMTKVVDENEYVNYVRKFHYRLEKGNNKQKNSPCEQMKKLARTTKEQYIRERALEIFRYFNKQLL
jgi:hypothetical protein